MMNERIKELMTKAFESSKTFEEGTCVRTEEVFEKFAELIIRECAALANSLDGYEGVGDSPNASYIKKCFGVE